MMRVGSSISAVRVIAVGVMALAIGTGSRAIAAPQAAATDIVERARATIRDASEAILVYRFDGGASNDQLTGTVLTTVGARRVDLGGDAASWRRTADRFRLVLREPGFGWDAANAAQALHDRLLKPLLTGIDPLALSHVFIVADPALRRLPFSALAPRDEMHRSWFGFFTAVTYAPDLAAVVHARTRPTSSSARPPHLVVVTDRTAAKKRETEESLLRGSPASRAVDRTAGDRPFGDAPVEWIHATAALNRAGFALDRDVRLGLDALPERVEFVLAPYVDAPADRADPVAIAKPLLDAGAGTILTTRWDLEPRIVQKFLGRYYHHLADDNNRSQALAATKREFSRSPGFGGPSTWAAFALVGDPATPATLNTPWRWMTLWWYVALAACLFFGYRVASVLAEDARARSQDAGESPPSD